MSKITRRSAFGALTGLTLVMTGVCAANADTITENLSVSALALRRPGHIQPIPSTSLIGRLAH